MIQSEVSILRRVKHPNIVLLIEEIDAHNELYLIMELVKVLCIYHGISGTQNWCDAGCQSYNTAVSPGRRSL